MVFSQGSDTERQARLGRAQWNALPELVLTRVLAHVVAEWRPPGALADALLPAEDGDPDDEDGDPAAHATVRLVCQRWCAAHDEQLRALSISLQFVQRLPHLRARFPQVRVRRYPPGALGELAALLMRTHNTHEPTLMRS